MVQFRLILKRLKKPSVIASLTSQIVALLILFEINIDTTFITNVMTAITSIMVILGIFSNPDSQRKGYKDDISLCSKCHQLTQHVKVTDKMVCVNCGGVSNKTTI